MYVIKKKPMRIKGKACICIQELLILFLNIDILDHFRHIAPLLLTMISNPVKYIQFSIQTKIRNSIPELVNDIRH